MLLESSLLRRVPRARHAFSTRLGGVSTGAFGTLNLGSKVGDDHRAVEENHRRFLARLGGTNLGCIRAIAQVEQVHGATVRSAPEEDGREGDALFTFEPGLGVAVRTADCAPILVVCTRGTTRPGTPDLPVGVAAIHAGWRSATQRIIANTVDALEARGVRREAMLFAIGPTIGLEAFEVGEEVIEAARNSLDGSTPPMTRNERGRPHLDLVALVELQLIRLGIPGEAIDRVGGCTHSNRAMFFSHRRDGGVTGRQLSVIAFDGHD